jgi:hypothetical protein
MRSSPSRYPEQARARYRKVGCGNQPSKKETGVRAQFPAFLGRLTAAWILAPASDL